MCTERRRLGLKKRGRPVCRQRRRQQVVSNAPADILGVPLYQQTHEAMYLTWSERIFAWLRAALFDPVTGLYRDHVDGQRQRRAGTTTFTCDEGVMLAAMVALSTIDLGRYLLSRAITLADTAMADFARHHRYGRPGFDVIWAENVLQLARRSRRFPLVRADRSSGRSARNRRIPAGCSR